MADPLRPDLCIIGAGALGVALARHARRFDVSVAEVGDHGQYRRSQVGAGLVAADRAHLVEVLAAVERFVAGRPEFELLSARQRELHSED